MGHFGLVPIMFRSAASAGYRISVSDAGGPLRTLAICAHFANAALGSSRWRRAQDRDARRRCDADGADIRLLGSNDCFRRLATSPISKKGGEPAIDLGGQGLAGELVDDAEHPDRPANLCAVLRGVVGLEMVGPAQV